MSVRNSRPGLIRGLYLIPAGFVLAPIGVLLPISVRTTFIVVGGFLFTAGLLWGIALLIMWPFGLLARRPGTPPRVGGPYLVVGSVVTLVGALLWLAGSITGPRENNSSVAMGVVLLTIGLTLATVGGWRLATRGLGAPSGGATDQGVSVPDSTEQGETQAPPPPGDTPEGWYPNPTGPGRRYWDGTVWTQHTAPDSPTETQ